jgi:hypothetical protein
MSNPAPPPGPTTHRDAKAEAKAAKAYAKAQRPWYKKKRFIIPLALVAIIILFQVLGGGGDDTTATTPETVESAASALPEDEASEVVEEAEDAEEQAPAAEEPAGKLPLEDGDWRLDQLRVEDDGLGDFGGTARITYTGDDPEGGTNIFTVTVFDKGGEFLGAMQGSAQEVKAGGTVSVQLVSTDKFVKGPYTYDFQNDL